VFPVRLYVKMWVIFLALVVALAVGVRLVSADGSQGGSNCNGAVEFTLRDDPYNDLEIVALGETDITSLTVWFDPSASALTVYVQGGPSSTGPWTTLISQNPAGSDCQSLSWSGNGAGFTHLRFQNIDYSAGNGWYVWSVYGYSWANSATATPTSAPTNTPAPTSTPALWMTPAYTKQPCATGSAPVASLVGMMTLDSTVDPVLLIGDMASQVLTATVGGASGTLKVELEVRITDEVEGADVFIESGPSISPYGSWNDRVYETGRVVRYLPFQPDGNNRVRLAASILTQSLDDSAGMLVRWSLMTPAGCPAVVTPTITRTPRPVEGTAPNPWNLPTQISTLVALGLTPQATSCVPLSVPSFPTLDFSNYATPPGPTPTPSSGYLICFEPQRVSSMRVASFDWLPFFDGALLLAFALAGLYAVRRLRMGG